MYMAVASEPTARLTSILPGFSLLKTLIFAMTAPIIASKPPDGPPLWALQRQVLKEPSLTIDCDVGVER